ncbi:uncharacterized protein F4807DRAFT_23873 [Annulohypoxylon truncatum]|uniref:uncharacterized protein n=1 Tax=Annulohypoxylon truncatum TaxID=327061 RepID=UPI002007A4A9|nr:uncharacterized protein F4807DRAFT_23873 [Annulohypoxylon truncatum]KAI1215166.1 hypothetical protein F4807DRAFT_23873 [Annulohypoxylon truncatum]
MDLDSIGPSSSGQAAVVPGRKSVPYGQACTNCSKAKCKCISRGTPGSAACERCQRLGKQCVPSVSVRKRAVRRPAAERTAHLEEKLDDLVSILRAQASGTPPTGAYRAGATTSDDLPDPGIDPDANAGPSAMELDPSIGVVPVPGADKAASGAHPLPLPSQPVEAAFCARYASINSYPTPPSIASSQDGYPSPAEAEEILRVFQDRFVPFFPFVYIPPETTAAQLQQERPFLWLTIACTCAKSQEKKAAYSQKIREYLSQKMLIELDRSVDLLLGVVCYLGWGMHHFTGKPYINAYINMATTIVADLRFDKPPQDNFYRELHCFKPTYGYPKTLSTHRTNEERRATLACFILCSGISNFLRTQTMRWTPHMEDSLQKLATSPETIHDELLVAMVRTYRIQEDVAQITWRAADHSGNSATLKNPPFIYVKALRTNLEAVKRELPAVLRDNKVFLSHYYAAEIAIADMCLWNVNPWLTAHPPRPAPVTGSSGGIDMGKLDAYYSSLQASKASLENFLSFAPGEYMCLSMPLTLHFGRATQTVYRLMVVDDPEWDRAIVKNSIDLMSVMDRAATRFLQVPQICGIDTADDPDNLDYYTKAANALRATIPSWTATLEQLGCASGSAAAAAPNTPAAGAGVDPQYPPGSAIPELSSMEWLDDPWLTDMLRSWEGS